MVGTSLMFAGPALLLAALVPLTALGARRRGNPWGLALLAGLVFPLSWALWYVQDELPLRSRTGRAGP